MNIIAIFCHSVELHVDWWSFYVFTWSDTQTFIDSQSAHRPTCILCMFPWV